MTPTPTPQDRIADHLAFLYGQERAHAVLNRLCVILARFRDRVRPQAPAEASALSERLTEKDVILITYGDQVTEPGSPPLQTLAQVLEKHVLGTINGVHILPFFPYSSDDGFSIIDYAAVNPDLGSWAHIERLGRSFRLMVDAVFNHVSVQGAWFQGFVNGDPEFAEFFIRVEEGTDLSQVVRPRSLPLLTRVQTAHGERLIWTTFSADQADLNYANPDVLLKMIEVLLLYVERGAAIIRLDAIAYLWKTAGTSSIHLAETHRVTKIFRAVLDAVAPDVILITETNVPHQENVSYFGDGSDEAQLVYQFSLPPLVLHTLCSGDGSRLSEWAAGLKTFSDTTTFFNFLASHDGIGLRPVEGLLSQSEVESLVQRVQAHSGYVSCRDNVDGTQSAYELNISFFDALSDPGGTEPLEFQIQRFLVAHAIMLSLAGVPGIYVHSLFGSRSHHAGVEQTGRYRSINREKLRRDHLEQALATPASIRHRVFYPFLDLIRARTAHPAFHPNGSQEVLFVAPSFFTVLRTAPGGSEVVLCIHNVTHTNRTCSIDLAHLPPALTGEVRDLVTGSVFSMGDSGTLSLELAPYQALWLTAEG